LPRFTDKGRQGYLNMPGDVTAMQVPFFPGPLFAWIYLAVLLSVLAAACYTDLGRMVVPKQVTLTALALGVAFNVVRGSLLGAKGLAVWTLPEGGAWLGAVDGLVFSLAGFALGFTLFFAMWIFGVCGGGDVKLFAALGAWVGPYLAICVLSMTLVVIAGFVCARLAGRLVRAAGMRMPRTTSLQGFVPAGKDKRSQRRILGFSLPLAIATALVLLWMFRVDLQFVSAPAMVAAGGETHAH
jgi:Flp pilus assembly protein protease CpaA